MTETENSKGKKILIIEDDKFFSDLLERRSNNEGFVVSVAREGAKGVEMAKSVKPDIVILDILMPGMDGYQVIEALKGVPETSSIPIIVLSNLGEEEQIRKAISLGAVAYLVKSNYELNEIVEKIKIHLNASAK